jgi:hypothetical protein
MGPFGRVVILIFAACWLGCGPAFAGKRMALVIGNSAYKNVPTLKNPVNDAGLVAGMFKNAGFDLVMTKLDVASPRCEKLSGSSERKPAMRMSQ